MENRPLSIIIPAYNEEEGLRTFLGKLLPFARERGWEVIVVDDGSTDATADVAREYGAKVISHHRNKGYGSALKTGIRNASNEIVVMMDSDGQHKQEDIERLVEYIDDYDMVVGARKRSKGIRAPGKKLLSIVANYLSGYKIPDLNSGFRVFRKSLIETFLHFCPNGFSFTTTITLAYLREGYSIKYVPIDAQERVGRPSTVKFFRDGYKTFLLIIRVIVLFILFFMGILADQISAIRRERHYR